MKFFKEIRMRATRENLKMEQRKYKSMLMTTSANDTERIKFIEKELDRIKLDLETLESIKKSKRRKL